MPLPLQETYLGIQFFKEMKGWNYHYWAAIKAMFTSNEIVNRKSHMKKIKNTSKRVFCSEAALLMCKHIGLYHGNLQPALCMPAQLYDIVCMMPGARRMRHLIPVGSPDAVSDDIYDAHISWRHHTN